MCGSWPGECLGRNCIPVLVHGLYVADMMSKPRNGAELGRPTCAQAYVGQKLVKSGRADNPWVLRGLGIGTLLFVGIMARRGQIHMIRTLAMQHAQEQR